MKPEWIARQASHPRGWIGAFVARVMAWDTARMNDVALQLLAVEEGETVLEIGCGHGRSLQRLATQTEAGRIVGIDPSAVMRNQACRRNAGAIAEGRVKVEEGDAAAMPFPDATFDVAFSVHTLYFWPDFDTGLKEIRRVSRPGGRLLLVHRPLDDEDAKASLPPSVYTLRSVDVVEKRLSSSGFEAVQTELHGDTKSRVAFTSARVSAALS